MSRVVESAGVLSQYCEAPRGIFRMRLHSPEIAARAVPGQFVHVRVAPGTDPLLRRPLSIHLVDGGELELVYRVVGRGTEILSGLKPGSVLDLLGPLGKGFEIVPDKAPLLVGGGLGVPPIHFLARELLGKERTATVVLGFADIDDVYAVEELEALPGLEVWVATEDGSLGRKGLVTDILPEGPEVREMAVYACGPTPMLAAVAGWAAGNDNLPCQVSLEERMGCGLGACRGCTVPVAVDPESEDEIKYRRVCTDGPVFPAPFIDWKELTGGLP